MKKMSHGEFIERVKECHGDDIKILGLYNGKNKKVLVRHICGYEWLANPLPLAKGVGCPKCSGNIKKDTLTIKNDIFNLVGDEYELLEEYINNNTPILFKHNVCGNVFKMSPKSFIIQGQRCPNERYIKSANSNTTPLEVINNKIFELSNGDYEIIGKYIKSSAKVDFLHSKCGKTFKLEPTKFINGGIRCPHCYRSKGEEVIREYLELNNIEFKEQYRIKECKNIRPLPFDFAIFDNGSLKCLIEYDGSQHFSPKFSVSDKEYIRIKKNDDIKNVFCNNQGIILIRVKYVRSENYNIFRSKVIERLENEFAINNMIIPSQAE